MGNAPQETLMKGRGVGTTAFDARPLMYMARRDGGGVESARVFGSRATIPPDTARVVEVMSPTEVTTTYCRKISMTEARITGDGAGSAKVYFSRKGCRLEGARQVKGMTTPEAITIFCASMAAKMIGASVVSAEVFGLLATEPAAAAPPAMSIHSVKHRATACSSEPRLRNRSASLGAVKNLNIN